MDSGGSSMAGDDDRAKGHEAELSGVRPKLGRNDAPEDVAFH